jgi:hypothetical protein
MIDILPDNVLLEIFSFCLIETTEFSNRRTASNWQTLVHVSQRWRRIVFGSPRRLNLNLNCSNRTPVRKNLGFWPVALPLNLDYTPCGIRIPLTPDDEDNIIAALEHPKRLHHIAIDGPRSLIRKVVAIMRKSFPALISLDLYSTAGNLSSRSLAIPGRFLGRSAPSLQHLHLRCISFPQLPTFLLAARNLVTLKLEYMPPNWYISPEAMTGSLSALTMLTTLSISFDDEKCPQGLMRSRPDSPIRVIFAARTVFHYEGRNEYLEDFLARIDTPRLYQLKLEYFVREIQALQLSRFIKRTENLNTRQFTRADVIFYNLDSCFELDCPQGNSSQAQLGLKIIDQPYLEAQVLSLTAVLAEVALFSNVDHLFAHGDLVDTSEIHTTDWLPFFRLFPAVRVLRLSGGVAASIVSALEDTTEDMVTDVFPALRLIWLVECEDEDEDVYNDPVESIERFLSLRQLAGRPVTIVNTEDEFDEAEESC